MIQNYRLVKWFERALLCLSLFYLCMHTLPRAWHTLNTDFPNYYMSARLAHEGYDTSRMYEWPWIEREKDHRDVDIRVIGLLPITPFSTLAVWPLTELAPLTAKHIWILINLAFLIPIAWILRSLTGFSYQRILLALSLSFPLHRNLLYGQLYVLILLLIVAACWSYLRGLHTLAGGLLAIAAASKVFPLLFFIFFLQRRDWRVLASGAFTGIVAIAASIRIFGWNVHRTWLQEILPWVMHGEGFPPYVTNASISGVLHRLFLSEPQWNPHPWHKSLLCYSILQALLPILVLAPAILLIRRDDKARERILLEWSALLTAALAVSTIPASYNFVLMVFPVCVLAAILIQAKRYGWLVALVIAYVGIGFPIAGPQNLSGLAILLYVPRLPLMLTLLLGSYGLLFFDSPDYEIGKNWTRYAWLTVLLAFVFVSMRSTFNLEQAEREEYAYRLPLRNQGFLNASPQSTGTGVRYTAFNITGYRLVTEDQAGISYDPSGDAPYDNLTFTSGMGHVWTERTLRSRSQIFDLREPLREIVDDAREPMLAADGQSLAFVRDDHGRGRLMVRSEFQSNGAIDVTLTSSLLNVYEVAFVSERQYVISAAENRGPPHLYLTDATHTNALLALGVSRYPALSPDERWMAYSHLERGVWNLWLRDQRTGATRRIADVPCNQVEPAWESDSKTLLYGTDCGRSVWFTAVARRKVIP